MVQTIERRNPTTSGIFQLLATCGPLTLSEIAVWLGVAQSAAGDYTRGLLAHGSLHRDEFGRVANWCAWPRIGI